MLPAFDEQSPDVPHGWGIEQNHDGSWYAYRVDEQDSTLVHYLLDGQGLDTTFTSRDAALQAIRAQGRDCDICDAPLLESTCPVCQVERLCSECSPRYLGRVGSLYSFLCCCTCHSLLKNTGMSVEQIRAERKAGNLTGFNKA